jgi:hypothetical protein
MRPPVGLNPIVLSAGRNLQPPYWPLVRMCQDGSPASVTWINCPQLLDDVLVENVAED